MIRLIVSDIDGTLVPEGSTELNPEYIEVIRALTDRGIEFAAASGRQASSIRAVFHEIEDRIYYLADNGAYIQRYGVPANEKRMKEEEVLELLRDARSIPNCFPVISSRKGFYMEGQNPQLQHLVFVEYAASGGVVENLESCADFCVKLSLYCPEGSKPVFDTLYEKWKEKMAISISGALWVDFNDPDSTKGNAVGWLQEQLGITPEETVVFGDNFNDISMLRRTENSYASVFSHPDVKKEASYEVASYEEDGVLQVLKKLLEEAEHE